MNKKIAQLIGWQTPRKVEAAEGWLAAQLVPMAERFIREQTERLDIDTLRVESGAGNKVTFVLDGYAADRESRGVFSTTVRGCYDVKTGALTRLE